MTAELFRDLLDPPRHLLIECCRHLTADLEVSFDDHLRLTGGDSIARFGHWVAFADVPGALESEADGDGAWLVSRLGVSFL